MTHRAEFIYQGKILQIAVEEDDTIDLESDDETLVEMARLALQRYKGPSTDQRNYAYAFAVFLKDLYGYAEIKATSELTPQRLCIRLPDVNQFES